MSTFKVLDQADEDALHKSRLLNVEEKPFKRITKRILGDNSYLSKLNAAVTPADSSAAEERAAALQKERNTFHDDVVLDFAAFEGSIARIQFLRRSNEKERERYAAEKLRILATAQDVRENTSKLRVQLEEAQKTLAIRKGYDELAEKITSNSSLKPRDEQQVNLEKLRNEIEELERESRDYAQTWSERRAQFGRIMEEGLQLRRLIRDEKEEAERLEGMEEGDDGEESRGRGSNAGTPKPETGGLTPMHPSQQGSGGLTPRPHGQDRSARGVSPLRQEVTRTGTPAVPEVEDADMADEGEVDESTADQQVQQDVETNAARHNTSNDEKNTQPTAENPSQSDQMDVS
ncbi:MAG: hypothetical protein Q9227_006267 [Pyrenula ochraceoflavens]